MIVLTGDIHNMSLCTRDQRRLPAGITEVDACKKYLEIANENGCSPTIYAPGKLVREEGEKLHKIYEQYNCELGGHTYNCCQPRWLYGISRRLFGLANGPAALQRWDIKSTCDTLKQLVGKDIVSWRNHAYREDTNTSRLVSECGIKTLSNMVEPGAAPKLDAGYPLAILPINTAPDHENLVHSTHNPNDSIDRWCDALKRQIDQNNKKGVPSIILAHPACMEIEDGMGTFKKLTRYFAQFKSVTSGELGSRLMNGPAF